MQTASAEDEYEVDIAITPGSGNKRVGTANYITVSWMKNAKNTALMCSADFVLISATDEMISVKESVTKGKNNCIDDSVVTLTRNISDGTLEYIARAADQSATGILKKVAP